MSTPSAFSLTHGVAMVDQGDQPPSTLMITCPEPDAGGDRHSRTSRGAAAAAAAAAAALCQDIGGGEVGRARGPVAIPWEQHALHQIFFRSIFQEPASCSSSFHSTEFSPPPPPSPFQPFAAAAGLSDQNVRSRSASAPHMS